MLGQFSIYKENSLPAELKANSFYCIPSAGQPDFMEIYVTNSDGTSAKRVPTHGDVSAMIGTALAGFTTIQVVADIAARDAVSPNKPIFVLVLDATADATVAAGSASYVYDNDAAAWVKVAEYESLDVVLSWDSIQGRPNSSVADIDDAVARRHSHVNKAVLDKVGEDANGRMTYQGMGTFVTWVLLLGSLKIISHILLHSLY